MFKKQLNMLHQIVGELEKASDAHKGQSSNIKKHLDYMGEGIEMENENELDEDAKMGKQSDDNLKSMMKKMRDPKEPSTKFMIKRIGKEM